jgi:hypothetical protein
MTGGKSESYEESKTERSNKEMKGKRRKDRGRMNAEHMIAGQIRPH